VAGGGAAGARAGGGLRIYTRTGDSGETGLLNGSRVPKDDPRVEASGAIDELSAVVGLAVAHVADAASGDVLRSIQRDLFALGARLADPADRMEVRAEKAQLTRDHVARLEQWIDESEAEPSAPSSAWTASEGWGRWSSNT